jgi:kinesin family protein 18/19
MRTGKKNDFSAKNIKCKVTENKKLVDVHISEYKNIIYDLRSEID